MFYSIPVCKNSTFAIQPNRYLEDWFYFCFNTAFKNK